MNVYMFFFCLLVGGTLSFAQQQEYPAVAKRYEAFLKIKDSDTTITKPYHLYKCSPEMSGTLTLYYQKDTLRLIQHQYKQGLYDDHHNELYYLENEKLVVQVGYTEIIHLNTYTQQDEVQVSTGVEKFLELVEQRTLWKEDQMTQCYERRFGAKLGEWDQDHFETLPFQESQSIDDAATIQERYRILRRAARFFRKKVTQKKPCIFQIW